MLIMVAIRKGIDTFMGTFVILRFMLHVSFYIRLFEYVLLNNVCVEKKCSKQV